VTEFDVQNKLARFYHSVAYVLVPNVSWGWGLRYEADLVLLRKSGWCDEIEIKLTASDIRADLSKAVQHDDKRFKRLWFAVPVHLADNPDIPERAGVISVEDRHPLWGCKLCRQAAVNRAARKLTDVDRLGLLRLAALRIWDLRETNRGLIAENKQLRETAKELKHGTIEA